jgi:signal peptidase I
MVEKRYSLRKCKKIFFTVKKRCKRRKKDLSQEQKTFFLDSLQKLQENITQKNTEEASKLAHTIEKKCQDWIPKSFFERFLDFCMVIAILILALCIRQMWFELYTIPTGSMRPTLRENDNLLVIKDPYGINMPTRTGHFLFDESKLKRGNVVVLSADNLDTPDPDYMYFYVIPGKKQFVKRLIGKPGDILYFYEGKIYGIDKSNTPITAFQEKWFDSLEHIPFIYLDGKVKTSAKSPSQGIYPITTFYQMNIPIAKLSLSSYGQITGKMLSPYNTVDDYYKLWGIQNYAKARIISKNQMPSSAKIDADYYLELFHHPSLKTPELKQDKFMRFRPSLHIQTSYIPLLKQHFNNILHSLTTARFSIKDGFVVRYGSNFERYKQLGYLPKIPLPKEEIPEDGLYEFQDGMAYKVGFRGYLTKLSVTHPIYNKNPKYIQFLYNLGYEFNTIFSSSSYQKIFLPSRYVYFRNNDLYAMNHPIIFKNDPVLKKYIETEKKKEEAFIAAPPPFLKKDGSYDISFLQKHGIKIPEKMYLVLGDNHSMSGDSREFGFVPQENLRGGASFIFFPPSPRWGFIPQPPWKALIFSRILFWTLAAIFLVIYFIYKRKSKDVSSMFKDF